jgi:16S rRNA (cytosine967-C5)-methyltransferase
VKRLEGQADRLLLDVPCTGTGVWRRNPDAKWRLCEAELRQLSEEQIKILRLYSRMLKPGGKMVYSTCSLLQSENQGQVQAFLQGESGQAFELEEEKQFRPSEGIYDGFYMARLKRRA